CFFFSSRRRHTRFSRDWSSDVCSSDLIVTLKLPPGTRVSEKSLSAELGIGRTPVREALKRLAQERTITIHPRSGAVISAIDVDEIGRASCRERGQGVAVGGTVREHGG